MCLTLNWWTHKCTYLIKKYPQIFRKASLLCQLWFMSGCSKSSDDVEKCWRIFVYTVFVVVKKRIFICAHATPGPINVCATAITSPVSRQRILPSVPQADTSLPYAHHLSTSPVIVLSLGIPWPLPITTNLLRHRISRSIGSAKWKSFWCNSTLQMAPPFIARHKSHTLTNKWDRHQSREEPNSLGSIYIWNILELTLLSANWHLGTSSRQITILGFMNEQMSS